MMRILVAGAAGRVGRHVARRLAAEGVALRLLVQSPSTLAMATDHEVVVGDFNDTGQMANMFSSVDAAFMYAPAPSASAAIFRTARAAGVRKVVLLSSASVVKAPPGANPIAERHRVAENAARDAGLDWVFIRPDTMASNCLQWRECIRDEGRVYTPCPESMRNPVHEDDIALLAAQSLLSDANVGRAFDITGPEVLCIQDQVDSIAAQLGVRIECIRISDEEAMARMMQPPSGLPMQTAQRLLEYLRKSVTVRPCVSLDYQAATGSAPRRFADWVRDNLDQFRNAGSPRSASTLIDPTDRGMP